MGDDLLAHQCKYKIFCLPLFLDLFRLALHVLNEPFVIDTVIVIAPLLLTGMLVSKPFCFESNNKGLLLYSLLIYIYIYMSTFWLDV